MTDPISIEYLEKRLLDQREETSNQLVVIHQSMNDSNTRTDKHLMSLSDNLAVLAKESQETRHEILSIVKDVSHKTNNHGDRLATAEQQIKALEKSSIIRGAWWGIAGVVSTSVLAACVKLLFFPA